MRTTRRWSVIAFLAVAALLTSMFAATTASAAPAPAAAANGYTRAAIAASGNRGQVGTAVTITGVKFAPNTSGTITFHSSAITVGSFRTNKSGAFSARITVPNVKPGSHTIVASPNTGKKSPSIGYTVIKGSSGVGGVKISDKHPKPGEIVTVSGTSCRPGALITVRLDGTRVLGQTRAKADGTFKIVVKVPKNIKKGKHTINVSGPGAGCAGVAGLSVTAADVTPQGGSGGGGLASTGVAVIGIGALGVVLLIGGALMLLASRRRRVLA